MGRRRKYTREEKLARQYEGYRMDSHTKYYRQARKPNQKSLDIDALNNTPDSKIDLRKYRDLKGMTFETKIIGEDRSFKKEVFITEVYPKCVVGVYFTGPDNDGAAMKTAFSIADLITMGIMQINCGYLEVIKRE